MLAWTLGIFIFCFLFERIFVGWKLPHVKSWWPRVLVINAIRLGVVTLAGITWEKWFAGSSLFQLSLLLPRAISLPFAILAAGEATNFGLCALRSIH